ncbi:MAG: hypothetical protein ACLUJG_12210 [Lawsonibacter sp.]
MFSFNNPYGACPSLHRPGRIQLKVDPELIIPDKSLSINRGRPSPPAAGATSEGSTIAAHVL